jgi:hypothetical protein
MNKINRYEGAVFTISVINWNSFLIHKWRSFKTLHNEHHMCYITQNVCVGPEKGRVYNNVLLALETAVLWRMHSPVVTGKTSVLWPRGCGEDRWAGIAPAVTVGRALLESAGARRLAASVVGQILLMAIARTLSESASTRKLASLTPRRSRCSWVHWIPSTPDAFLLYVASYLGSELLCFTLTS